jgi:hypothetical protein
MTFKSIQSLFLVALAATTMPIFASQQTKDQLISKIIEQEIILDKAERCGDFFESIDNGLACWIASLELSKSEKMVLYAIKTYDSFACHEQDWDCNETPVKHIKEDRFETYINFPREENLQTYAKWPQQDLVIYHKHLCKCVDHVKSMAAVQESYLMNFLVNAQKHYKKLIFNKVNNKELSRLFILKEDADVRSSLFIHLYFVLKNFDTQSVQDMIAIAQTHSFDDEAECECEECSLDSLSKQELEAFSAFYKSFEKFMLANQKAMYKLLNKFEKNNATSQN